MAERKRTSGNLSEIDRDLIAEAVRAALLEQMTHEEPSPRGPRAWRVSIMSTAMLIFLGALWHVGRAAGWN